MHALRLWQRAPSAAECQPPGGAEHLMPLFVCAGIGEGLPPSRVEGLTTYVGGDASGFDAHGIPSRVASSVMRGVGGGLKPPTPPNHAGTYGSSNELLLPRRYSARWAGP